jgi:hypothetical protein
MEAIDRRSALRGMLCAAVAAGCSTALLPTDAEAVPLVHSKEVAAAAALADDLKHPVQAVASRPPPRPCRSVTAAGGVGGGGSATGAAAGASAAGDGSDENVCALT